MSYIWEHYSEQKRYTRQEILTPYFETCNDESFRTCYVNPLLRFDFVSKVFTALEEKSLDLPDGIDYYTDVDFKQIENVVFHLIAIKEFGNGLDEMQVKMNFFNAEIEKGFLGKKIKNAWKNINVHDKNVLLYGMVQSLSGADVFFRSLIVLFAEVSIIYEKSENLYYLYIGEEKNEYRSCLLNVAIDFFWNMSNRIEIVWKNHFGIIGNNKMMRIDFIVII